MKRRYITNVRHITGLEHTEYLSTKGGPHIIFIYYLGGGTHIVRGIEDIKWYINALKESARNKVGEESQIISIYSLHQTKIIGTQIEITPNGLGVVTDLIGMRMTAEHHWGLKMISE